MGSLTAHLRRTDDHGGLPFHPDCPVCRAERVSGTLTAPGQVGRRTQAAVVAAMLAASTAAPTAAAAQEADQVTEGVAPEGSSEDGAVQPEFDPGGADENLVVDEPEAVLPDPAPAPEAADPGLVESEPVTDSDEPAAGDQAPVPAAGTEPDPLVPTPAPQHLEQRSAPAHPAPVLVARIRENPEPKIRTAGSASVVDAAPGPEAQAVTQVQAARTSARPSTPTSEARTTKRVTGSDARHHVVRPGESLWSIAREVLGRDASPARIAREVNVLWELNSAQIATGDPDMLRVGTKLSLR